MDLLQPQGLRPSILGVVIRSPPDRHPVDRQLRGHSSDLSGREGTEGGRPDGAGDRAPPPTPPLVVVERAAPQLSEPRGFSWPRSWARSIHCCTPKLSGWLGVGGEEPGRCTLWLLRVAPAPSQPRGARTPTPSARGSGAQWTRCCSSACWRPTAAWHWPKSCSWTAGERPRTPKVSRRREI